MSDDEEANEGDDTSELGADLSELGADLDDELKNSDEYKELLRLTRLQRRQQQHGNGSARAKPSQPPANARDDGAKVVHPGYTVFFLRVCALRASIFTC